MATQTINIAKRETIAEASAHALIRYIVDNGLKAGDRLPSERELVEMTGISRLPLREGLSMLRGLGVVEAYQGKGVFVKAMDMAGIFRTLSPLLKTQADIDVQHIFEVRLHLEASIAELAAANRTDENLGALDAALNGMRENYVDDRRAYIDHDMTFHQELARATGNPLFHVLLSSITDLLAQVQSLYRDQAEFRERAIQEHAEILEAVRKRAPRQATSAMQQHMRNAGGRI